LILKEYALDPIVINDWNSCVMYMSSFGVTHGRQISGFPKYKNWKSTLKQNLDCGPRTKQKINVYLRKKKERENAFLKSDRLYINSEPWVENAEREQSTKPFQAVISLENKTYTQDNFISDKDFSDLHDLMEANVNVTICRNVQQLTHHLKPLLDQSRTIIFVDPYFNGTKKRFLNPLEEFLTIIGNNPHGLKRISIQYHHNDGGAISNPSDTHVLEKIKSDWKERILSILPESVEIQFHMWPFRNLHNRYILTDVYGVSYGRGLSEDNSGFADEDEILGLGLKAWRKRYDEFLNTAPGAYMVLSKE